MTPFALIALCLVWGASAAAPACSVTDAKTNIAYDLSPLRKTTGNWIVEDARQDSAFKYYMNVCAPLNQANTDLNCLAKSGVCQKTGDKDYDLGDAAQPTIDDNGNLVLTYTHGTQCKSGVERSTYILFVCDPGHIGEPIFVAEEDCTYAFEWRTNYACAKPTENIDNVCRATDATSGEQYDLSPLTNSVTNWLAVDDSGSNTPSTYQYYINVCRGLVPIPNMGCSSTVGACQAKPSDSKFQSKPLGHVEYVPKILASGTLSLLYDHGEPCHVGSTSQATRTTLITFTCDPGSLGVPKFIRETDSCQYVFLWATSAACPIKATTGARCSVTDPVSKRVINLADLVPPSSAGTSSDIVVHDAKGGADYHFSLCGPLAADAADAPCHDSLAASAGTLGACQVNTKTNAAKVAGLWNASPSFDDGSVTLNYINGDLCHHNNKLRRFVILFTCDSSTGGGQKAPEFLGEGDDCSYLVRWPTSLVCSVTPGTTTPPVANPIECTATDPKTGHVYDLSPLSDAKSNWEAGRASDASGTDSDQDKYRYFLSVCDALAPMPSLYCPLGVSACQLDKTKPEVRGHGLGLPAAPLVDPISGKLELHYDLGDPCHTGNRTVLVEFECLPGEIGEPVFVREASCQYFFLWRSSVACVSSGDGGGTGHDTGSNCAVSDASAGVDFDLTPLGAAGDQSVVVGDYTYALRACDSLATPAPCTAGSAVCQSKTNDATFGGKSLGSGSSALTYKDGTLSLVYSNGDKCHDGTIRSTTVLFTCDQNAGVGKPQFVGEDTCSYSFVWPSSYACSGQASVECMATDSKGNQFDLTALSRTTSNWVVPTVATNGDAYEYLINVCRPIVAKGTSCPAYTAACQTKPSEASFHDKALGHVVTAPHFNSDGVLELQYVGGQNCSHAHVPRTTTISFTCDADVGLGHPAFVEETAFCSYEFVWATALACRDDQLHPAGPSPSTPPAQPGSMTCTVRNPTTNEMFSLESLRSSTDYVVPVTSGTNQYEYHLAVCGVVKAAAECGSATTAACQLKKNTPAATYHRSMGVVPATAGTLTYNHGVVQLTYAGGDKCHDGSLRSTVITFTCDPSAGKGQPSFVEEASGCAYAFEWKTSLVCSVETNLNCVVSVPGVGDADLSALTKTTDNWQVTAGDYTYQLNVCAPVNAEGTSTACPSGVGACQTKPNDPKFGVNMGLPASPSYRDGSIVLEYDLGQPCHVGSANAHNRSVFIQFQCNKGSLGVPTFVDEIDCQYQFEWRTSAACPIVDDIGSACTVTDSLSAITYDFSSLSNETFAVSSGDYTYYVRPCAQALASECGTAASAVHSGACQSKPTDPKFTPKNIGIANAKVSLVDGLFTMVYTGGAKCHDDTYERSTVITFSCNREAGRGAPKFVEEKADCTYVFEWATELACVPGAAAIECAATDPTSGFRYDLTPLVRSENNWVVSGARDGTNDYEYQLNVCQPVVRTPGTTLCSAQAAACQLNPTDATFKGKTLGVPAAPMVNAGGVLTLEYDLGDSCHNGAFKRSALVTFTCERGTLGEPEFVRETSECQYQFEWASSVACNDNAPGPEPTEVVPSHGAGDCTVVDRISGFHYDLSPLSFADATVFTKDYTYQLHVCGAVKKGACGEGKNALEAGACQLPPFISTSDPLSFRHNIGLWSAAPRVVDGVVQLDYVDGEVCHHTGTGRRVTITFPCDATVTGVGKPSFVKETDDCGYLFEWASPYTCTATSEVPCTVANTHTGDTYDLSPLMRHDGTNWLAKGYSHTDTAFYLAVCQPLSSVTTGTAKTCPPFAAACENMPSKAQTHGMGKAASPELNENGGLMVQYKTGGDTSDGCPAGRKTTILFTCQTGALGEPVFVERTDACEYFFEWASSAACAVKAPTQGQRCRVSDATGNVYDLSPLEDLSPVASVVVGKYTYEVAVCGHLPQSATGDNCGDATAGACQRFTDDSGKLVYHSLGASNEDPSFATGGRLSLTYKNGEACHDGTYKRSTLINFVCDRSAAAKAKGGMLSFVEEQADCTYSFEWRTSYACAPGSDDGDDTPIDCSVTDSSTGLVYDLTSLMRSPSQGNWVVTGGDGMSRFELNVCHALVGTTSTCPSGTALCQQPLDKTQSPVSLGVANPPHVRNGAVLLSYTHGSPCKLGTVTLARTAVVFLTCRRDSLGHPEFQQSNAALCQDVFVWETSAACTDAALEPSTTAAPSPPGNCMVTNPHTGVPFDLSSMERTVGAFYSQAVSGGSLEFNICGGMATNKCKDPSVGLCLTQSDGTSTSLGVGNGQLLLEGSMPTLTYTQGDMCNGGGHTDKTTIIRFRCDTKGNQEGHISSVSNENNCFYELTVLTSLVCPTALVTGSCTVADPVSHVTYDLSLLSRVGAWTATSESHHASYYLNVCEPVHGISGCPPQAGACVVTPPSSSSGSTMGVATSLGLATAEVQANKNNNEYTLTYSHGVVCRGDSVHSTVIHFKCHASGLGNPVYSLDLSTECTSEFVWLTSVVCPSSVRTNVGSDCRVSDPLFNTYHDLTPLRRTGGSAYSVRDEDGTVYLVNVCGSVGTTSEGVPSACAGAGVCDVTHQTHLGTSNGAPEVAEGQVTMTYGSGGKHCSTTGESSSSLISFVCDNSAGNGAPTLLYVTPTCEYVFEWRSAVVCGHQGQIPAPHGSGGSHHGGTAAAVIIVIILVIAVVLVMRTKRGRAIANNVCCALCKRDSGRLSSSGYAVAYTTLGSGTDLANLMDDDDDDLLAL